MILHNEWVPLFSLFSPPSLFLSPLHGPTLPVLLPSISLKHFLQLERSEMNMTVFHAPSLRLSLSIHPSFSRSLQVSGLSNGREGRVEWERERESAKRGRGELEAERLFAELHKMGRKDCRPLMHPVLSTSLSLSSLSRSPLSHALTLPLFPSFSPISLPLPLHSPLPPLSLLCSSLLCSSLPLSCSVQS